MVLAISAYVQETWVGAVDLVSLNGLSMRWWAFFLQVLHMLVWAFSSWFVSNSVKRKRHFLICYHCVPLWLIRVGDICQNGFYILLEFLFISLYIVIWGYLFSKILGMGNISDFRIFSNDGHDDTNSNFPSSLGQRAEVQNAFKGAGQRTASVVSLQFLPSNQFETESPFFFCLCFSFQFFMSASHLAVVKECNKDLGFV